MATTNEQKKAPESQESGMPKDIAVREKNISDTVLARVKEMEEKGSLVFPASYAVGNALKSAWLKLLETEDRDHNPALAVCTKESIANALLDMVVQGLSPAKTQCYFIVYGKKLTMQRSYFGTVAVMKRLNGVEDAFAQVIYADDVFEYIIDGGNKVVTKHEQKLQNIDNAKIIGAYAIIMKNGKPVCDIMTKAEIEMSWSKRKNSGTVQKEFPQEMAKRTVLSRAAKMFINTSDDNDLLCDAINRTTANESLALPDEEGATTVIHDANSEDMEIIGDADYEITDAGAPSAAESPQGGAQSSTEDVGTNPGF